jgi:hypothetical protein
MTELGLFNYLKQLVGTKYELWTGLNTCDKDEPFWLRGDGIVVVIVLD